MFGMKKFAAVAVIVLGLVAGGAALASAPTVKITDIKMTHNIDEKFMPVQPSKQFPVGTTKLFCWFEWKNAEVGDALSARWAYLTDKIMILEHQVSIPRAEGRGGIALAMPGEKNFPAGLYEVRLENSAKKHLKTIKFRIVDSKK